MASNHFTLFQLLVILTFAQLPLSSSPSVPIYNPSTGCHDLPSENGKFTFAICLQRAINKQHTHNLYTAPSFCSQNYPPHGQLLDFSSLSSPNIDALLQSLTNLFKAKDPHLSLPPPNFLWISSNSTQNETINNFWCPRQCQGNNQSGKFLILKLGCQLLNASKSCISTKQTHWNRAPFICQSNRTIRVKSEITPEAIRIPPSYPNETIVFHDSDSCVIVRTRTHQYTFCFRRQLCLQTLTSAFCSTKPLASRICNDDKNASSLLTIENDDEYELVSRVISEYSGETLLDVNGTTKSKYVTRAQWMWVDGVKGFNNEYQWNTSENVLTSIPDKYWCNQMRNCSGGKGREHVVLNIICQLNKNTAQPCLASRRESEPGPFICKRLLTVNEEPVSNYTFLKNSTKTPLPVVPVYEKNSTHLYYDEHHCLSVQTRSHLYSFCLRRQNCTEKQAFCTKWSEARKQCQLVKNQAQLLTIENESEQILVKDTINSYHNETRLVYDGSTYRYYDLADFVWIDGVQQPDKQTYLWGNKLETIPEHLWCPKDECTSLDRDRVMLSLICNKTKSSICLATRLEWTPAPYICKRTRPIDQCPIKFDQYEYDQQFEMLIVAVNRTVIFIKCKHPDYNTEIKVEYHCNTTSKQWQLDYTNENFTCPGYEIPPIAMMIDNTTQSTSTTTSTSSTLAQSINTIPTVAVVTTSLQIADCSQAELSILVANLPAESRYVIPQRLPSYSSLYYNIKLTCQFNNSIQIIYRCDLLNKRWLYIYGNTNHFRMCSRPCNNTERMELLNKYFTRHEQSKIQTIYLRRRNQLRLRCLSNHENQWKTVFYSCGTMAITPQQWYELHSCFQAFVPVTEPPAVMVSMSVTELPRACPPAVQRGSPCEHASGQYIFDVNGCARKVCPSLSSLCNTIRCPSDRICRVISCKSCVYTDYLQAVCEYPPDDHYNTNANDEFVVVDMTLNV
ncbi:unnamed protein product [Adineta ricciae]|uniref:C-type lectin domain-containing protein n=1 Tax=Adineta ricciae TaxID=249248 RepID=A0A814ACU5_ADIRI|nr:unnamed protein product [Adineta ricciae]